MAKTRLIPDSKEERAIWFENFDAQLPVVKSKFDLTTSDVTGNHNDCVAYRFIINQLYGVRVFDHQCSTYFATMSNGDDDGSISEYLVFTPLTPPTVAVGQGIFKRVRVLIKKIKGHKNYKKDIGRLLGIEGINESKDDMENIKTTITSKQSGGFVQLKFVKGIVEGFKLECKRGDETEFTLVDKITKVTFSDKRSNLDPSKPEARIYRVWCVIKDEIVGQVSDVLVVTVTPV